jgi:hypothetical protein
VNIPFDDLSDVEAGYSLAWDEPRETRLQGFDVTFFRQWPQSYHKLKWQNEFLFGDIDEYDTRSTGLYSLLQLTLDKNWEIGGRYDWSQSPADDTEHEWAVGPFVTYYFNESFYTRAQYRHRSMFEENEEENTVYLQLVWGMGPHSHRLEN